MTLEQQKQIEREFQDAKEVAMNKDTLKVLQDIASDARACSQPQVPEEFAKSTLVSIASRLESMLAEVLSEAEVGRC